MKMPMMALTAASLFAAGCAHLEVGTSVGAGKDQLVAAKVNDSLGAAGVSLKGLRPLDEKLLEADLLSDQGQWGDIASVDVWPIAGVGIGWCGLGVHVLQLEAHAGILGYRPHFPPAPVPPPPPAPDKPI